MLCQIMTWFKLSKYFSVLAVSRSLFMDIQPSAQKDIDAQTETGSWDTRQDGSKKRRKGNNAA